jgi:hypothetical protein
MKVLAIGNSFSEDATRYLHQIGEAAGVKNQIVNLYIGGCPLETHWENIESGARKYLFQMNGKKPDYAVSIPQVLEMTEWDVIITQQASHDSGWAETYEPFLSLMCGYLREKCPQAKLYLHQTWAYEIDSPHGNFMRYSRDQALMYRKLTECYTSAAQRHDMTLIPCGNVIQTLRQREPFRYQEGGMSLCRDGFHMHLIYGRYALSCTWAKMLCDAALSPDYLPVSECDPSMAADPSLLALIRQTVNDVCNE